MKRIFISILILILCSTFMLVSCGESEPPENNEESNGVVTPNLINLSKLSLDMYTGDSYELGVTVIPQNASTDSIEWDSTNDAVATVENGVIYAHSVGSAIIRATSPTSKPAVCNVTVKEKPLTEEEMFDLVSVNLPEFPMLINYTDPQTDKSSIIRINDAIIRMNETRDPNSGEDIVQVFIKFDVEKVYDDDGINGLNPIYFEATIKPTDSQESQTFALEKKDSTAVKVGDKIPLSNPENSSNISILANEMGISFGAREYRRGRSFDIIIKGKTDEDIVTEIPLMPDSSEYESNLRELVSVKLPEFPVRINYTDPETGKSAIAEISEAVIRMREVTLENTGEKVARVFVKFSVTKIQDSDGYLGKNPIFFKAVVKAENGTSLEWQFEKRGENAIKIGERVPLSNPNNVFDFEIVEGEIGFTFDAKEYLSGRSFEIELCGADDDDVIGNTPSEPDDSNQAVCSHEDENGDGKCDKCGADALPENPTDDPSEIPDDSESEAPTVDSIELSKKNLYIEPGKSFTLNAILKDATGATVTSDALIWESTDESIVTCADGVITAKNIGMAAIYAKVGSVVQVCMVTVLEADRMVIIEAPEFPIELEYEYIATDSENGYKTGFKILGYTAEYELDHRDSDGNFVRVNMKFLVEKTFDSDGNKGENSLKYVMNIYENRELKQTVEMGDTKLSVGDTTEIEYIFGARFHEGKRTFNIELVALDAN